MVFLTRNTSITLTEIDNWSWFEFEMYMTILKKRLDEENEEKKRQNAKEAKQQHSMKAQMDAWLRSHNYKFK
jgi:hypothetical protein